MRILGYVEIRKSIAVVIADGNSHSVCVPGHSGFHSHIGESAITVIAIERVPQGLWRTVEITGPAVDEVNIHPAIVVVIEKCATRSDRFWKVRHRRASVHMHPCDSAGSCWNFLKRRRRSVGSGDPWTETIGCGNSSASDTCDTKETATGDQVRHVPVL